jgi:DNA-directed RNA polymerase specialized sigma24 family protein
MLRELQFKYLSNRHADDVFWFALALLGYHAYTEDAAQEVLIKLWPHFIQQSMTITAMFILMMEDGAKGVNAIRD